MKKSWASPLLSLVLAFTFTGHALPVQPDAVLRGSSRLQPDGIAIALGSANRSQNMTHESSHAVTTGFLSPADTAKWWLKDNDPPKVLNTSGFVAVNATSGLQGLYAGCAVAPQQACTVNKQLISKNLIGNIVLILGCSLDIYALNYFCKSADAPVIGYTRNPGNEVYEPGNFAYCNMGGLILAYSFHPGSSGPPYFEACDKVLHGPCSSTRTEFWCSKVLRRSLQHLEKLQVLLLSIVPYGMQPIGGLKMANPQSHTWSPPHALPIGAPRNFPTSST